ncbi:histidine phosphatase family protein [Salmonella enterica]|nr:histidine phosphatase family protein [Salmonella enterica subsp. enterica serovar Montevideo]EGH0794132.1 histidine phosphatase family protein [Salmonella enterica subsp. enterica serovar Montevideo]
MTTLKSVLYRALLVASCSMLLTVFTVQAETTIVFLRHGEKPKLPTGQLTCKGFNRALALPAVLLTRFGIPDAIYASAPKENKTGSSLRPLATILPTAIRAERPMILKYHATETDGLVSDLLSTSNKQQRAFVSWEHKNLVVAAKALVRQTGGDPQQIPSWPGQDFDRLYIVKLNDQGRFESFSKESEGLNGVSDRCQQ